MQLNIVFSSIRDAINQIFDSRLLSVLMKALMITFVTLSAASYGAWQVLSVFWGNGISLPLVGDVHFIDWLFGGALVVGIFFASIFLMPPVAILVVGLFLDEAAEVVEETHYPHLHKVKPMQISQALQDGARFTVLFIMVNLLALIFWPFFFFLGPVYFWIINGVLLSHEYFMLVAKRRMLDQSAKALLKSNRPTIFLCGAVMAFFLNIPVLNILIPIVGVAAFTHLYHRLRSQAD